MCHSALDQTFTAQTILEYRIEDTHLCALRWEGAALLDSVRLKVARLHQSLQGKIAFWNLPASASAAQLTCHTLRLAQNLSTHTAAITKKVRCREPPTGTAPAMQTTLALLFGFSWAGRVRVV